LCIGSFGVVGCQDFRNGFYAAFNLAVIVSYIFIVKRVIVFNGISIEDKAKNKNGNINSSSRKKFALPCRLVFIFFFTHNTIWMIKIGFFNAMSFFELSPVYLARSSYGLGISKISLYSFYC